MSVNPGFGGQKFIANTFKKITDLVALKNKAKTDLHIEIDGGVNLDNYPLNWSRRVLDVLGRWQHRVFFLRILRNTIADLEKSCWVTKLTT